jgi:hypothetical protein
VYPRKPNVSSGSRHCRVFLSFTVNRNFSIICRIVFMASSAMPGLQQITKSSA